MAGKKVKARKRRVPYVYFLYWSASKIGYIGSQYGKKAHPSNIWTTYFTSSVEVAAYRTAHGDPDKIFTIPCDEYDGQAEHLEAAFLRACRIEYMGCSFLNRNAYGNSGRYSDEYVYNIYEMVGSFEETAEIIKQSAETVWRKVERLRCVKEVSKPIHWPTPTGKTVVNWTYGQRPKGVYPVSDRQKALFAVSRIPFPLEEKLPLLEL